MAAVSVNAVGTLPDRCRPIVIRPIGAEILPVTMFLAGAPLGVGQQSAQMESHRNGVLAGEDTAENFPK